MQKNLRDPVPTTEPAHTQQSAETMTHAPNLGKRHSRHTPHNSEHSTDSHSHRHHGNAPVGTDHHPHTSARSRGRSNSAAHPTHNTTTEQQISRRARHRNEIADTHLADIANSFGREPLGHESDYKAGEDYHVVPPSPSSAPPDLRDRVVTAATHHIFLLLLVMILFLSSAFFTAPNAEAGAHVVERTARPLIEVIERVHVPLALLLVCAIMPRWKN